MHKPAVMNSKAPQIITAFIISALIVLFVLLFSAKHEEPQYELTIKELGGTSMLAISESEELGLGEILLVYSDDDKTVHKAVHCDPLLEKLEGKSNIHFLIVSGKDHNPTFTYEGLKQKTDFFNRCQKAIKKKQLETPEQQKAFMDQFDWEFITRQDMEVWQKIFDHLRS